MRISAAILARPNDKLLAECVANARKWADEVVVGSCGGIDADVDVSLRFSEDLLDAYGFACLRNRIDDNCTGDWIVIVDTDEELDRTREDIERWIVKADESGKLGVRCFIRSPDGGEESQIFRIHRRNAAHIRWRGIVHEELYVHHSHIIEHCLDSDLVFDHHRATLEKQKPLRAKSLRLYSERLYRAIENPELRSKTNEHWFGEVYSDPEKWKSHRQAYWSSRGVRNLHHLGGNPWASHVPLLHDLVVSIPRPARVVELGCGLNSTPFLNATCSLRSYDTSPLWANSMQDFRTQFVADYSEVDCSECNIVFIDGAVGTRRIQVERLADVVPFIVCHDTESNLYGYDECLPRFKYKYTDTRLLPWTTVVSNFIDLSFLGGGIKEYIPTRETL